MEGPKVKNVELTIEEQIEVLNAEMEVEYNTSYEIEDEYHIIFPED